MRIRGIPCFVSGELEQSVAGELMSTRASNNAGDTGSGHARSETTAPIASFTADAVKAYLKARDSLVSWVMALPKPIRRPRDLQLLTQLDYTLCWQIITVTKSQGLEGAAHVPGPVSLKRMIAESKRQKLPEQAIEILTHGLQQYYDAAKTYADTRAGFGSMLAAVTTGETIELSTRKSAYRSESEIWGRQLGIIHQMVGFSARPTPSTMSSLLISSSLNCRRLRPNAGRSFWGYFQSPEGPSSEANFQPFEEQAFHALGAPLMPQFCSSPLPRLRMVRYDNGWTHAEVEGDGLGRRSAVDVAFGVKSPLDPLNEGIDTPYAVTTSARLSSPTELLVMDLMVHRPSFGEVEPQLLVHANSPGSNRLAVARQVQQLHVGAEITSLESTIEGFADTDATRAPQIVQYLIDRERLILSEFDCYRVKIPFPVLNSVVRLYVDVGP
jgi:hypothetical protein